jgi:hypothetical protein
MPRKKQNKIYRYLNSNNFILLVSLLTVLFLAPNTYYVFYKSSVFTSPWRELASIGVAFIVAASIMIFTLRKNEKLAYFFSLFEISIGIYYYMDNTYQEYGTVWHWVLVPRISFALMLPYAVRSYALEFLRGKWLEEDTDEVMLELSTEHIQGKIEDKPETEVFTRDQVNDIVTQGQNIINDLENKLKELNENKILSTLETIKPIENIDNNNIDNQLVNNEWPENIKTNIPQKQETHFWYERKNQ